MRRILFVIYFVRSLASILLVASLVFPPEALGQDVTKRVVFSKDKTSVAYKGKLQRIYTGYDSYIFRAKKGQTLSVKLATSDPGAILAIYETKVMDSAENTIVGNDQKLREWSGKLPVKGQYEVQVYVVSSTDESSSGAAYTVTITLR